MTDPLTDKIEVRYHRVYAIFDERWPDRTPDFMPTGERIHKSRDAAIAVAAQEARGSGAPEDARVIFDYDIDCMVDRVIVDWHTPHSAGQPALFRNGMGKAYESFRLSEVPR